MPLNDDDVNEVGCDAVVKVPWDATELRSCTSKFVKMHRNGYISKK